MEYAITKTQLETVIKSLPNKTVSSVANHLDISHWATKRHIEKHNIVLEDGRALSSNKIIIPPKKELEDLYSELNILDISKHYGNVSNVTVKKWFKAYGIETRTHAENIKKTVTPKIVMTCMEKYGVKNFYQSKEFNEKSKVTCMEKYGTPYYPYSNTSKAELDVLEFVNTLSDNHVFQKYKTDNGFELDMYCEKAKVAIEYCGLYWHSEKNGVTDLNKHKKKLDWCKNHDIRLFTIFENEWRDRKPQVQGFLKSVISSGNRLKIAARKCEFSFYEGSIRHNKEVESFGDDNHVQGKANKAVTKFHSVLRNEGEIVSIMSFGVHHRGGDKKGSIVLSRYTMKQDTSVIGGVEKLFTNSIKLLQERGYTHILSWSDNRWSDGGVYRKLGFEKTGDLPPDYSYVKAGVIRNKQQMTKKKLGIQGLEITERQETERLGWFRIYDCGKQTWLFTI